jgi:hypothetical protein
MRYAESDKFRKPDMSDRIFDSFDRHHRLRWEIAAALLFKVVLLGVLWFVVFRHDPAAPRPPVTDLFSPGPISASVQEGNHGIR